MNRRRREQDNKKSARCPAKKKKRGLLKCFQFSMREISYKQEISIQKEGSHITDVVSW